MFHHPRLQNSSSILSPSASTVLCAEVTHQANGKARYVPPQVQAALDRLQKLEGGDRSNVGSLEHQLLLGNLREYRDALKETEARGFPSYRDLHRYQGCLFSFIESPRKLGDFHAFCHRADLPKCVNTIKSELFTRNAAQFLIEVRDSMQKGSLHTHLTFFLEQVRTTPITDPHTKEGLLDTLTNLYVRNAIKDLNLILKIAKQGHTSVSSARTAAENLISCDTIDRYEDRIAFWSLGELVAHSIEAASIREMPLLRSHPIVNLGFLTCIISKLSSCPSSPGGHAHLCQLYQSVPEYFFYIDGDHLRKVITTLQASVGQALNSCNVSTGKELATAAKVILQQPWDNTSALLWNLCTHVDPVNHRLGKVSVQVLGYALSSDENLKELKEQVYKYAHLRDLKANQQLIRVGRLMGMILESDRKSPEESTHARNAVELLRESRTASKEALPSLMRLLGVPGVAVGTFGFLPFPWKVSPHPDERVRSKTRELLLSFPELIGPFALRRIQGA